MDDSKHLATIILTKLKGGGMENSQDLVDHSDPDEIEALVGIAEKMLQAISQRDARLLAHGLAEFWDAIQLADEQEDEEHY